MTWQISAVLILELDLNQASQLLIEYNF